MIKLIHNTLRRLLTHDGLKKYGVNISWLFFEKFVRMAIGFSVGIYVARQLGPANYGILNYALSYVGIFAIVAGLGLDSIVVRELVRTPEKKEELLGSAFLLRITGFIVMLAGASGGLVFSNNDQSTNIIVLVIAGGYLFQSLQVIDFYFQAEVKSKYVALSQITALLIVSVFRLYFAYYVFPLLYFAIIESAYIAITFILYVFFYVSSGNNIRNWKYKFNTALALMKSSWPLLLSGVAGMIYMRIDQVMIKSMLGDAEVGYYAVAVRLVEIWYFIPMIICSSLFPAIIRSKDVSEQHYERRVQKLVTLNLILSAAIILSTLLLGHYIVRVLYGESYLKSASILCIYIWVIVMVSFGVVRSKWLITEKLEYQFIICGLAGIICNVGLNYLLIRRIGLEGACYATVISQTLTALIIPLFMKKGGLSAALFFNLIYFKKYNHLKENKLKT